ncbi:MAG: aconitate hydratase AcnA [Deltaproteobacteria bacterium]|nr:aconitate hydratase AcnA [Deltaproteobacteria bacterium]
MKSIDTFGTRSEFKENSETFIFFSIKKLADRIGIDLSSLPMGIRVLLENLLRHEDGLHVTENHIRALIQWSSGNTDKSEIPFMPGRILMQDFTGVPSLVDLAAMRDALSIIGGDPELINPHIPVHLIIDHSVQVDKFGTKTSFFQNTEKEFERNRERYTFLKWGQKSFKNFNVVPPATGICHQVNLEYLARVVMTDDVDDGKLVYPDTLVGLDSHTTMINGAGVLGWGVGGIEAEAVMLGQPYYLLTPEVIGFKLSGALPEGTTATDLVLTIASILRQKGVVGKFIEFFGPGLNSLALPDRATIANMTPEFGATMSYFPVDEETLNYLRFTGRSPEHVALIKSYLTAQSLFRTDETPAPQFSDMVELDMNTIEPSLAGPRHPHARIALKRMKETFLHDFQENEDCQTGCIEKGYAWDEDGGAFVEPEKLKQRMILRKPFDDKGIPVNRPYQSFSLDHGAVVIAAITSCTNTSNPQLLVGAGLMAKKAVEKGLMVRPWVKTSLAPGSKVVADYLKDAGLLPYLEALRFHLVAHGCTTCIGNSGQLQSDVSRAVEETNLIAASVLSGNRNYDGRINPQTIANYLASPMLVVAYALAGTININLNEEPLGHSGNNEPVFLHDIWPTRAEIRSVIKNFSPKMYQRGYRNVFDGDKNWADLYVEESGCYNWDERSEYIKSPPFFTGMSPDVPRLEPVKNTRVLVMLGDTVSTDHISPAGAIPPKSPAERYLREKGVERENFNSFGSRRGNHEVMMRGTFGNARLKNLLAPGTEGGWTRHLPDGETLSIYDAAMKYKKEGTPLIVLAGREYGSGSSRDWAAKGTLLLGIRAVIAESFERIHRSNLVSMGVLPLQFLKGESVASLGLTGEELFSIIGICAGLTPNKILNVRVEDKESGKKGFDVIARLDSAIEVEYYRHGGILPYVLRRIRNDAAQIK